LEFVTVEAADAVARVLADGMQRAQGFVNTPR